MKQSEIKELESVLSCRFTQKHKEHIDKVVKDNEYMSYYDRKMTQPTPIIVRAMEKDKMLVLMFLKPTYSGSLNPLCLYKTDFVHTEKYDYAKKRSSKNVGVCNSLGLDYSSHAVVIPQRKKDEAILEKYLNCKPHKGDYRNFICNFDNMLYENRAQERRNREQARVDALFAPLKTPPRSFFKQIDAHIEHYFRFDKENHVGFSTCCEKESDISDLKIKNRSKITCPHCGREITAVSIKCSVATKEYTDMLFSAIDKEHLCFRYFTTWTQVKGNSLKISTYESLRYVMGGNEWEYYEPYGNWHLCKPSIFNADGFRHFEPNFKLYTRTMRHELEKTRFKNCGYIEFVKATDLDAMAIKRNNQCLYTYFISRNCMNVSNMKDVPETLIKAGLIKLAQFSALNDTWWNYRTLSQIDMKKKGLASKMGIQSQYLRMLQENGKSDDSYVAFEMFREATKEGVNNLTFDKAILLHYFSNYFGKYCYMTEKQLLKIKNYCEKNNVRLSNYDDYMTNCMKLRRNTKADYIRFPKDFQKAHNEAMEMMEVKKQEMYEKSYKCLKNRLGNKFTWETKDFIFRLPEDVAELYKEAEMQHNCITRNGYHEKMLEGKCIIVFARCKKALDKSYVTIELNPDNGYRVVQAVADEAIDNGALPQDFIPVLENYKKKCLSAIA